jgi:hypothetical protein
MSNSASFSSSTSSSCRSRTRRSNSPCPSRVQLQAELFAVVDQLIDRQLADGTVFLASALVSVSTS